MEHCDWAVYVHPSSLSSKHWACSAALEHEFGLARRAVIATSCTLFFYFLCSKSVFVDGWLIGQLQCILDYNWLLYLKSTLIFQSNSIFTKFELFIPLTKTIQNNKNSKNRPSPAYIIHTWIQIIEKLIEEITSFFLLNELNLFNIVSVNASEQIYNNTNTYTQAFAAMCIYVHPRGVYINSSIYGIKFITSRWIRFNMIFRSIEIQNE